MIYLILFARDDSLSTNAVKANYQRFDVVDILDDSVDLGKGVTLPTFYIVACDATLKEVEHLKEEHVNITLENYELFHRRLYSLDLLPAPYYDELIATGQATVPLGIVIANQRIKA